MRPRVSWADLQSGRVGVWGAGVEGTAALRKLRSLGLTPAIVVDDLPPAPSVEGVLVVATSPAALDELGACTYVIKTPGISRYRPDVLAVEARGAVIVGALGVWLESTDQPRVACVTGTKGKSTTVSIAGALAEGLGAHSFVGGNIGRPPYDPGVAADADYWLIETSSYQACDISRSAPVVAVTSLHPDHLTWHGDAETYFRDKLSACSQPGARVTVANGDDPLLRARRHLLAEDVEWVHAPEEWPEWTRRLGLLGRHNLHNALIAQRCLVALGVPGADDADALAEAAKPFPGLESRLRQIGRVGGVRFVDDSLSTNVLSTTAAISAFGDEPVALLVGGFDRGIDYRPLAEYVARRAAPLLVLTLSEPDNGERIRAALEAVQLPKDVEVRPSPDLEEAVAAGFDWRRPDGVVLLSPAAPSFGRYRDYRDRAEAFRKAMHACGPVDEER